MYGYYILHNYLTGILYHNMYMYIYKWSLLSHYRTQVQGVCMYHFYVHVCLYMYMCMYMCIRIEEKPSLNTPHEEKPSLNTPHD